MEVTLIQPTRVRHWHGGTNSNITLTSVGSSSKLVQVTGACMAHR